jgi:hypothetical protein
VNSEAECDFVEDMEMNSSAVEENQGFPLV